MYDGLRETPNVEIHHAGEMLLLGELVDQYRDRRSSEVHEDSVQCGLQLLVCGIGTDETNLDLAGRLIFFRELDSLDSGLCETLLKLRV